ncbi:MAG: DinB family protein [Cyanobacteria bacterium J06649_4]
MHHSLVLCTFSDALQDCRRHTLSLLPSTEQNADVLDAQLLNTQLLNTQAHSDFSPVGWHLGHIAYTESLWIAEHLGGLLSQFPDALSAEERTHWKKLFAADGLPKSERQNLPSLAALLAYLEKVRSHTLRHLEQFGSSGTERLWHWLIQHESQHAETIAMVLAMHQLNQQKAEVGNSDLPEVTLGSSTETAADSEMMFFAAGEVLQGYDGPEAIDNECPAHRSWVEDFWLDRPPT